MKKLLIVFFLIINFKIFSQSAAALNFNGIDNYIDLPNANSAFDISSAHIKTIQFWFKSTNSQGNHVRIFSTGGANWSTGFWVGFAFNSPFLKLELSDGIGVGVTLVGNSAVRGDNLWHHASAVFNGTLASLYLDGASQGTVNTTAEGQIFTSGSVHIGNDQSNEILSYFTGTIDELRVWDRVLCLPEIKASALCQLSGTETGLAAYYRFNQGNSGANNSAVTNLVDLTVSSNTGTLINFSLTGSISNWVTPGAIISGSMCGAYTASTTVISPAVCAGQTVNAVAAGADSYTWMPGTFYGSSVALSPTVTTIYTITSTNCLFNSQAPVTSTVAVNALPVISVSGNSSLCLGSSGNLIASGANTYTWSTGQTSSTLNITPTITTNYSVAGTYSSTGCQASKAVNVFVDPCAGIKNQTSLLHSILSQSGNRYSVFRSS